MARLSEHCSTVGLHSAIGYIIPADLLAGRGPVSWAERDARLEAPAGHVVFGALSSTMGGSAMSGSLRC